MFKQHLHFTVISGNPFGITKASSIVRVTVFCMLIAEAWSATSTINWITKVSIGATLTVVTCKLMGNINTELVTIIHAVHENLLLVP